MFENHWVIFMIKGEKKRIGELKIDLNIQSEEQREKLLKTT